MWCGPERATASNRNVTLLPYYYPPPPVGSSHNTLSSIGFNTCQIGTMAKATTNAAGRYRPETKWTAGNVKQPYHIRMANGEAFAFAGLWETWTSPDGDPIESCTILTTEPNELIRPIHNRMPTILTPDDYDRWLDPTRHDVASLQSVLRPQDGSAMTAHAVSRMVNNPHHDSPECIRPIS